MQIEFVEFLLLHHLTTPFAVRVVLEFVELLFGAWLQVVVSTHYYLMADEYIGSRITMEFEVYIRINCYKYKKELLVVTTKYPTAKHKNY